MVPQWLRSPGAWEVVVPVTTGLPTEDRPTPVFRGLVPKLFCPIALGTRCGLRPNGFILTHRLWTCSLTLGREEGVCGYRC